MNERTGDPIKGATATIGCCSFGPIVISAVFLGIYAFLLSVAFAYEDQNESWVYNYPRDTEEIEV